jgi:hypothetical protein
LAEDDEFVDSPKAPPRRSMAVDLEVEGDLTFGEVAPVLEVGLVTGAEAGSAPGRTILSGSGMGPSIAHRLLSYLERMNCSILLLVNVMIVLSAECTTYWLNA